MPGYTVLAFFLVQKEAKKHGLRPIFGQSFHSIFNGGYAPIPPLFRLDFDLQTAKESALEKDLGPNLHVNRLKNSHLGCL